MTEIEYVNYLLNKMNNAVLSYDEYRALQYFLIKNYASYSSNFPITETFVDDNSLLFISDTHIGSEYENKSFIYGAYNYAVANDIKTVIHTGDLIEGKARKWGKTKDEIRNEFNNAIQMINQSVKTKLLFGNHDFSAVNVYAFPELLDLFFGYPFLDILGLGRIIMTWNNVPIGLNHYVSDKMVHFGVGITKEVAMVLGHSHLYFANPLNNVIKVPSLSDELKNSDYYSRKQLAQFGINFVSLSKPYMNFLKASFVDTGVILFEEIRQNEIGNFETHEKVLINSLTKEMKIYNS